MKIKNIMTTHIIYARDTDTVQTIAQKMKQYDIGFLPIIQNNQCIGVCTDRDIIVRMIENQDASGKIHSYLSTPLITMKEEDSLEDALSLMSKHQVKRLLVTREEKIVGIVSFSDIYFASDNIDKLTETLRQMKKIKKNKTVEDTQIDTFYL